MPGASPAQPDPDACFKAAHLARSDPVSFCSRGRISVAEGQVCEEYVWVKIFLSFLETPANRDVHTSPATFAKRYVFGRMSLALKDWKCAVCTERKIQAYVWDLPFFKKNSQRFKRKTAL